MGYDLIQENNAYELVSEVIVSTATTQVDITGLNITKEDDYMLVVYNPSAYYGSIYFNTLLSNANYYYQYIVAEGTGVPAGRSQGCAYNLGNATHTAIINLKLTNNSYVVYQSNVIENNNSNIRLAKSFGSSTSTLSNITNIILLASATNGYGIGSRFQLYKRVAELVADVTISSATTQVDITGLSIGKDVEYTLVSDVITNGTSSAIALYPNNNTTSTNYYTQTLYAASTTVGASRSNINLFVYAPNGNQTLAYTNIKLTNNGYFTWQSNTSYASTVSTIEIDNYYGTSTFTMTSITDIKIVATIANTIGVGSRFQLFKSSGTRKEYQG